MPSIASSSMLSAIGQTVLIPCKGSRTKPEMKLEAAEDGAPVLMQTVGSLTVRPSMKPGRAGW